MAPGFLQRAGTEVRQSGSVISAQGKPWNQGDFGFDLGGPILENKLWFYVGVAPSFNRIRVDRQLSRYEICDAVDPENGCRTLNGRRKDLTTGFDVSTIR